MSYYYSRKLRIPFEQVVQRLTTNLLNQGFEVTPTIDLQYSLMQTLNINFRKYKMLAACHPVFAYQAITFESHSGLMLSCQVAVQERENGEVEVSAMDPLQMINKAHLTIQLCDIATRMSNSLRVAIDGLHRKRPEPDHPDALPAKEHKDELACLAH